MPQNENVTRNARIESDSRYLYVYPLGSDPERRDIYYKHIRSIDGHKWDQVHRRWTLPNTQDIRTKLSAVFSIEPPEQHHSIFERGQPPTSGNRDSERTTTSVGSPASQAPTPLAPGTYLQMTDQVDPKNRSYAVISHSPETRAMFLSSLEKLREQGLPSHRGSVSGHLIDQLGRTSSLIASTLQANGLLEIAGTPGLVKGLEAGIFEHMRAADGLLTGTVIDPTSGQIAGQLRFVEAPVAPIVAPIVLYQAFNAIAGIHQLEKINQRLDCLQRSVDRICDRMQASAYGRLKEAIDDFVEIERIHAIKGTFDEPLYQRLLRNKTAVGQLNHEMDFITRRFQSRSESVLTSGKGHQRAYSIDKMLREEADEFLIDAGMLLKARQAGLYFRKLELSYYLQNDHRLVNHAFEQIDAQSELIAETVEPLTKIDSLNEQAEAVRRESNWLRKGWEAVKGGLGKDTVKNSVARRRNALTEQREAASGDRECGRCIVAFRQGDETKALIIDGTAMPP